MDSIGILTNPRLYLGAFIGYLLVKVLKLVKDLYRHNKNLAHVPTNHGIPLKFGCYQEIGSVSRYELYSRLGEFSNSLTDDDYAKRGCPVAAG